MALQVKDLSVSQTSSIAASNIVLPSSRSINSALKPATRSTQTKRSGRVASLGSSVPHPLPLAPPLPTRQPLASTTPKAAAAADLAMESQLAVPKTMNAFLAEAAAEQPELLQLFDALQTATKMIAGKVARAGIEDLYGSAGEQNSSGDKQKKLDVVAVGGPRVIIMLWSSHASSTCPVCCCWCNLCLPRWLYARHPGMLLGLAYSSASTCQAVSVRPTMCAASCPCAPPIPRPPPPRYLRATP
jgi:hypothetical protein